MDDQTKNLIKNDTNSLIDNAILGSALAKVLFSMTEPSVGLLNVGIEDMKGNENVQKASEILSEMSNKKQLNYYGFVEGADISNGITNVIVTDGFTGNIALKTAEGTANFITKELKKTFTNNIIGKLSGLINYFNFKKFKKRLDPRLYNGAIFIGLDSPVIKSHGATDYIGFSNSLSVCEKIVRGDLISKIKSNIA